MKKKIKKSYGTPSVEVIEVLIERGAPEAVTMAVKAWVLRDGASSDECLVKE